MFIEITKNKQITKRWDLYMPCKAMAHSTKSFSEKQATLICCYQNMPSSHSGREYPMIGPFLGGEFDTLLEPELQDEHESGPEEINYEPGEGH